MRFIILLTSFLLLITSVKSQITVSGFISDAVSNEVLVGAYAINTNTGLGASTNNYGYFSLKCQGNETIQFSYVGYEKKQLTLNLLSDTVLQIFLTEGEQLSEIVVRAPKQEKFNTVALSVKQLNAMPVLGGKPDVLKAMQLLPGIESQSEGSSLMIVRGGSPGENLYLLDNAPLIYVNHIGGVISVFNPDMINTISVYKGAFPAQYGGKLSSIVNIAQRSGNKSELKGTFSIGITDASLSLEGPIGNDVTFMFSTRKTLYDILFYGLTSSLDNNEFKMLYGFHDVNAKLTWKPNLENSLYFNFYQGDDYLNYWSKPDHESQDAKTYRLNIWGNWLLSAGWNHTLSPKLFLENNFSYTRYRLKEKQSISESQFNDIESKFTSSVQDLTMRSIINYNPAKFWTLKAGLQPSFYVHTPYEYYLKSLETFNEKNSVDALQAACFIDNSLTPFKTLEINIGLRSLYYTTGSYNDAWFEPRLSITQKINSNNKLNLSCMQVRQTSHLLHTTGSVMNNEVWIPATQHVPMANSWQCSMGYMGQFVGEKFSTELSFYYKELSDLATYKEGTIDLKGDVNWESRIETGGLGTSYGVEFSIKKNYGDWTGSLAYTWSNTTRKFQGINNGNEFLYDYNRPHNLTFIVNHKLGKKWDFNLTWVYQSGLPYTPVVGRQYTPSLNLDYDNSIWETGANGNEFYYEALIYGERNSARMSDYHRLDVGFNYTTTTKRLKRKAIWSFSVYNLYNRQNPSYYYYNNNNTSEIHRPELNNGFKPLSMYQMSLFPIIPSVSYKLFFYKGDNPKSIKERLKGLLFYE